MIEIRNKKGTLIRKKKLNSSNEEEKDKRQSQNLLKKIGVLNSKEIADHNLKMVKRRKSNYEFQDLNKQLK